MTTQANYMTLMGIRLGERFDALWKELYNVNEKWAEYVTLYSTKPERIALLNSAAPVFFGIAQEAILHDIVLSITRLTEERRDTMTVYTLPHAVKDAFKKEVRSLVAEAQRRSEICKEWRDKHIAHRNADIALKKAAVLPPLTKVYIQKALDSIGAVLSTVHDRYTGSGMLFERPSHPGGASELLHVLDDGVKVAEGREKRLHSGKDIRPEDWTRRDF